MKSLQLKALYHLKTVIDRVIHLGKTTIFAETLAPHRHALCGCAATLRAEQQIAAQGASLSCTWDDH